MTSKRLYKVTLTGWVVKNENQAEVTEWAFDTIVDEMIGEQLMVNFIDSNDMIVTPTRSDVIPEKRKPGRPPKVNKTKAEKDEDQKAKELRLAAVYGAGDKKLEELEEKWDGIIQEANVDNTDKYLTDPAQEGRDAVKAEGYAEVATEEAETVDVQEALDLIEAKDKIDKRQADEADELPPLIMEFEGDDEEADASEMSL